MVWMRFNQLLRVTAIAGALLVGTVACQPTTEPTTDDSATAPAETPDSASPDPVEPTTPSEPADPAPEPSPDPAEPTTPAPQPIAQAEQSCSVSAFVADTDPAGLNVRGGPGSDYEVIETLPTNEPVEVSIVGASNGWLLVNEAYGPAKQELTQLGWIYAPLLGVTTTSLNISDPDAPALLYAEPDGNAAVVAEVPKFTEVSLLSCSGNWLEVNNAGTTGWLAVGDQCSNPASTCP